MNYITVTQINNYLKEVFDKNPHLQKIYLKGEISNFKRHSSGHLYLTLKDDGSRISAIMFRGNASKLTFNPEDGMNVLVTGRVSVYPENGQYQIYIDTMEVDGLGNLYIEFEKLKKKLLDEGLFNKEHKKELPKFPMKIGIVTAPTGAAIKDIISTIKRRFPICETILFPSLVQGASAKDDIARNIELANTYDIDLLIVGRGGGSIEDLWAFNEEVVARAIFNSKVPVISAVGHEIDYTIADYVADMRAPTPTGAAEMAVPTMAEVKSLFLNKKETINHLFMNKLNTLTHELKALSNHYILQNPRVLYEVKLQNLAKITDTLNKNILLYIDNKRNIFEHLKNSYVLVNPQVLYKDKEVKMITIKDSLLKNVKNYLTLKENNLQLIIQTVKLVNPLNILDKGYSLVKKDGKIIKDIKDVNLNDQLDINLFKGNLKVEVKEKVR